MKALELTGQTFNRLTVLHRDGTNKNGRATWLCVCICGQSKSVAACDLVSGNTSSCGCLHIEVSIAKCKARKTHNYESAFHDLYIRYRRNAGTRNLVFELTHEEFYSLTNGHCHYCGTEPQQVMTKSHYVSTYTYNGIDRLDNAEGYVLNNCVACCGTCNKAKLAMSRDEFLEWIKRVYEYNELDRGGP